MKLLAGKKKWAEEQMSRAEIRMDRRRLKHQIVLMVCLAIMLNIIIELFNQRGVVKLGLFVIQHPLMFVLDAYLIFNTLVVSMLSDAGSPCSAVCRCCGWFCRW